MLHKSSVIAVDNTQSVPSTYEPEITPTLPYACISRLSTKPQNVESLVVIVSSRSSKNDHKRNVVLRDVPRVHL